MFEESQDGGSTFRLLDSLAFVRCLVKGAAESGVRLVSERLSPFLLDLSRQT